MHRLKGAPAPAKEDLTLGYVIKISFFIHKPFVAGRAGIWQ